MVTVETALCWSHIPALREAGPFGWLIAYQVEQFAADEKIGEKYAASCPGLP